MYIFSAIYIYIYIFLKHSTIVNDYINAITGMLNVLFII